MTFGIGHSIVNPPFSHTLTCGIFFNLQQVYSNNPLQILANKTSQENADDAYAKGLILGGEAPLWSEQVRQDIIKSTLLRMRRRIPSVHYKDWIFVIWKLE